MDEDQKWCMWDMRERRKEEDERQALKDGAWVGKADTIRWLLDFEGKEEKAEVLR